MKNKNYEYAFIGKMNVKYYDLVDVLVWPHSYPSASANCFLALLPNGAL